MLTGFSLFLFSIDECINRKLPLQRPYSILSIQKLSSRNSPLQCLITFLARKTRPTRPRWNFLSLRLELGVVDQGTRALELFSSLIDNGCALVSPIEVWLLHPKKHLGIRCKDKGLWVVMEALPLLVPPPPLEVLYQHIYRDSFYASRSSTAAVDV